MNTFTSYLNTTAIMNQLGIIGPVNYSETLGVINLRSADLSLNLFSDGTLIIRGGKEKIEKELELILSLIKWASECIGCGICISQCVNSAIKLNENRSWIDQKLCNHCRACLEKCPIIKYA